MTTLGVVIPTFVTSLDDVERLELLLLSIFKQTKWPDQIIISDDSDSQFQNLIVKLVRKYFDLPILYIQNQGPKGVSSNSNNGISNLVTDFVHCIHQDDSLINSDCYSKVHLILEENPRGWIILGGTTNSTRIVPKISKGNLPMVLRMGVNSLGGPSSIVFPKIGTEFFDEKFHMLCDIKMFLDLEKSLGRPTLVVTSEIMYGTGPWQLQNRINDLDVFSELINLNSGIKISWVKLVFHLFLLRNRQDIKLRGLEIACVLKGGWYFKIGFEIFRRYCSMRAFARKQFLTKH